MVLCETPEAAKCLIEVSRSISDIALNFRLGTAHGQLEAIVDHAFKDDQLVGRYRFYASDTTATDQIEACEIWTVLFDANCRATWEPEEDYRWSFTPGAYPTASMMWQFVLALLGKIQARLPRYKSS
jgi:hypothetical protein